MLYNIVCVPDALISLGHHIINCSLPFDKLVPLMVSLLKREISLMTDERYAYFCLYGKIFRIKLVIILL